MKLSNGVPTSKAVEFLIVAIQQRKNLLIVSRDAVTKKDFANYLQAQVKKESKVLQEFTRIDAEERLKYIPDLTESVLMQTFGTSPKTAIERLEVFGMSGGVEKSVMRERLFNAVDLIVYVEREEKAVQISNISAMRKQGEDISVEPVFEHGFLMNVISKHESYNWIQELTFTQEVYVPRDKKLLRETSAFQFQH